MARPREFDIEVALEGAMQIFWKNGYGATNLPDLLKAMKITRGSFYKAFRDKRSVYIDALRRYDRLYIQAAAKMLVDSKNGSSFDRLVKLFTGNICDAAPREERRGCLMCNAMVELGPTDAAVASLTTAMYGSLQKAVLQALSDIETSPVVDKSLSQEKSIVLTNLYFGSQAISKSGQPAPNWKEIIQAVIGI
ncbi:MAG: TetR/AcrR family transcriptional regulator [Proteobacteria bacterium]|nr:TetR/AcrR family transcriptional regulator [Pseudomonadota bacterium]